MVGRMKNYKKYLGVVVASLLILTGCTSSPGTEKADPQSAAEHEVAETTEYPLYFNNDIREVTCQQALNMPLTVATVDLYGLHAVFHGRFGCKELGHGAGRAIVHALVL